MIELAALAGVVILVLLWLLVREREASAKLFAEQAATWHRERQELITRIQRPDFVPALGLAPRIDPDALQRLREQQREFNRVGSVAQYADDAED